MVMSDTVAVITIQTTGPLWFFRNSGESDMSELNIQLCPETGICSIIKGDGSKVDLMPNEVTALRDASGNPDGVRESLAEIDSSFAEGLAADEIAQVSGELK